MNFHQIRKTLPMSCSRYIASSLLLAWAAHSHGLGNPVAVAGLAATAALAERGRIRIGGVTEASISVLPTVFAAAVLGPLAAIAVAAASFIGDFPLLVPRASRASTFERGAPYLAFLTNVARSFRRCCQNSATRLLFCTSSRFATL